MRENKDKVNFMLKERSFYRLSSQDYPSRGGRGALEVPDYYTEINAKGEFKQASGVYRRKDVSWGIESRPGNIEYVRAIKCRGQINRH